MCIFCQLAVEQKKFIKENSLFYVIFDRYPVTKGHILIVSKRHVEDYFSLRDEEKVDLDRLISQMKVYLDEEFSPDGYNIGINNGREAGQTILHFHLHLIPRYRGDTSDPRGGVRGVIADKQKY